jgi:hypothetical protein
MTIKLETPTTEPQFEHDCPKCIYLGTTLAGGHFADLYVHPGPAAGTVVARFSNEGSDYTSGLCFSYGANAALTVARLLAEQRGMLPHD